MLNSMLPFEKPSKEKKLELKKISKTTKVVSGSRDYV